MSSPQDSQRPWIIYNPTARGERARRFRSVLDRIAAGAEVRATTGPGSARRLAREAVESGGTRILAAGGDGTAFEVINGMREAPEGWSRAAVGVIPLGTANVLALELGMPLDLERAWEVLRDAEVRSMDACRAEYRDAEGASVSAYFAIVAGAGLDARAVQQVDYGLKRRLGKLAYIWAAFRALTGYQDQVLCRLGERRFRGRVVLAGNGRLYAGEIAVFADGSLDSGKLHVRAVERVTPGVLLQCLKAYLTGRWELGDRCASYAGSELVLEGEGAVPLQLDGEFVGWLPARLSVVPGALRVLVPRGGGRLGAGV
jgi:YegS/Rv2252/BmrU family lipid kinase